MAKPHIYRGKRAVPLLTSAYDQASEAATETELADVQAELDQTQADLAEDLTDIANDYSKTFLLMGG
jgi:hypothetical protein